MHSVRRFHNSIFGMSLRLQSATLAILLMLLFFSLALFFVLVTAQPAQAQTLTVLHTFTYGDGAFPQVGLTMDSAGDLYGTTVGGGPGNGTVFKLGHRGSGWVFNRLYGFPTTDTGAGPKSRVAFGPDGTLYGTTLWGGGIGCQQYGGCGTTYQLTSSPTVSASALSPWNEAVIHSFSGNDGWYIEGDLAFDRVGNLYVTAPVGGSSNVGLVYQLRPSNGGWAGSIVYSFTGLLDGSNPIDGVVVDSSSGDLYGVTQGGGTYGCGTVYRLSRVDSRWQENTVYYFNYNSGWGPEGGLIFDDLGNLYGTTAGGGAHGGGTVFQLNPNGVFNVLYNLPAYANCSGDYCGSQGKLAFDTAGNLYGTIAGGGPYGWGSVFKLSHESGGWTYADLHDFSSQSGSDGAAPMCTLIIDAEGNIYGTTDEGGGPYIAGVVFEITP